MIYYNMGKYEFCANYIYDEHAHQQHEINYINVGRCIMVIEEKNVTLRQGDCIILLPNVRHNFMVDGSQKCQITQLEFVIEEIEKDLQMLPLCSRKSFFYKITNCSDVLDSISHLYRYCNNEIYSMYQKQLRSLELRKLCYLLSIYIEKEDKVAQVMEKSIIENIMNYINNHYETEILLEDLAKKNKISSRYMRKLFECHIGFSASEYIHMLRMERAKDLLKNSNFSVSDISLDVGYNSLQYFSTTFKKKIGISPLKFRNQYNFSKQVPSIRDLKG